MHCVKWKLSISLWVCPSAKNCYNKIVYSVYVNLQVVNYNKRNKSPSNWASKSNLSTGYRYYDGKMVNTSPIPHSSLSPENSKQYLFEALIGKLFHPSFQSCQICILLSIIFLRFTELYAYVIVGVMRWCVIVILQEKIEAVCGIKCNSGKMCF